MSEKAKVQEMTEAEIVAKEIEVGRNLSKGLTEKERKIIVAIATSEYRDGSNDLTEPVWSDCGIYADGIELSSYGGIFSSLKKKGLIGTSDYDKSNPIVWLEPKGVDVFRYLSSGETDEDLEEMLEEIREVAAEPKPVEVPNYATKALETAYGLLYEDGARKLTLEELNNVESLLNVLACSLHPETREAGDSMNFVDLFERVRGNEDATPIDRAYYHITLAQSALISLKQERA